MIKYLILLFNFIGLFLYQVFFQANVNVTQTVPPSADPGSSFMVEVSISKADISGFAKYQEDLPKGFTAVAVEKQGATVLSSDNAIKFIWASLPSDATIKISFKVTVDPSVAAGPQPLSGKFLYVVNNERQETDVPATNITINAPATPVATNTVAPTPTNTVAPTDNNTANNTSTPSTPPVTTTTPPADNNTQSTPPANNNTNPLTPPTTSTPATPSISVSASRNLSTTTVAPAGDMTVSITVHKGNLSGFAKLEETLPNGCIAADGEKAGASFTFVDNTVKFVWLSLPTDSVFTVSYKVTAGSTLSGTQNISGEFSYLQDNNAMKYSIAPSSFTVQSSSAPVTTTTPPATTTTPTVAPTETVTPTTTQPATTTTPTVAATETVTPTTTQPATTTTPTVAPTETVTPTTTTTPTVAATETVTPTTTTPPANNATQPDNMASTVTPHVSGAEGGIMYRVQIMALHNPVKASLLSGKFKLTEKIYEEMVEGFTKYTVGHFDEYKASRDHREELKGKGVDGPFVVAYNNGKRVTVQEALMITHQQWYK